MVELSIAIVIIFIIVILFLWRKSLRDEVTYWEERFLEQQERADGLSTYIREIENKTIRQLLDKK